MLALMAAAPLALLRPRWRQGLPERLGAGARRVAAATGAAQPVWVHAVSVGEVVAVTRLVQELDAQLGRNAVVVSTTTRTGQQLAAQRFGADRCFYFPLDLPWAVVRTLRALRPRLLLLAESELWPNVLTHCARRGVPVLVVNARISDRSLPRYLRLRALWRPFLRMLSLVLAQSEEDARRFAAIGVPAERVRVGGNLKYDAAAPAASALVEQLRGRLAHSRVLVAGSTLEDEESLLLQAWPAICRQVPEAMLVLAPRHPERFERVAALVQQSGFLLVRRSQWQGGELAAGSVFLLDSIGELAAVYGLAQLAFVGGSMVAAGGHNPLEPARLARPVLMGPHYENFRDAVGLLKAVDALSVVQRDELAEAAITLLSDAGRAAAMGARGQAAFEQQAGAIGRAVQAALSLLPGAAR